MIVILLAIIQGSSTTLSLSVSSNHVLNVEVLSSTPLVNFEIEQRMFKQRWRLVGSATSNDTLSLYAVALDQVFCVWHF